jgi:hypothetical protein
MSEPFREQVKQDILEMFGVSYEAVEALDAVLGEPRRRLERYVVTLPDRMAVTERKITDQLAGVLPEGVGLEWPIDDAVADRP